MNKKLLFSSAFMLLLLAAGSNIMAQTYDGWSQATACPAWNNPNSFTVTGNNGTDYWQGRNGGVSSSMAMYNPATGETGVTWSSTTYSASQMAQGVQAPGSCSGSTYGTIPDHQKFFARMTTSSQAPGHPVNMDPNTGDHLRFVPTQFNTTDQTYNTNLTCSFRIGDDCSAGNSTADGAAALYYYCQPTPDNALLFIYYACVIEAPRHGTRGDPKFIIRVMKQNASGQWVQIDHQHLAYYISSTPTSGSTDDGTHGDVEIVPLDQEGWHQNGSGYNAIIYKDWSKVALNLSNYMYQNLRIEVMVNDCLYNAHFGYAYIAGECRRMSLDGTDTILSAPDGMMAYEWAASEYGYTPNPNYDFTEPNDYNPTGGQSHYFTFRVLADSSQATPNYQIQPSDFRIFYRPNNAHAVIPLTDSIGFTQTIRCRMKSALNPAYPYWSTIYQNVNRPLSIYTLQVESSDATLGTVTGGGTYYEHSTATLYALAQKDCTFRGWSDGSIDNPYQLTVSSDSIVYGLFSRADTVTVHDTIFLFDTVIIHDTIYITGIDDVNLESMAKIYTNNGQITVETEANTDVIIFNIAGQPIAQKPFAQTLWRFDVPTSGTYLVRVGGRTTRRVVVIK